MLIYTFYLETLKMVLHFVNQQSFYFRNYNLWVIKPCMFYPEAVSFYSLWINSYSCSNWKSEIIYNLWITNHSSISFQHLFLYSHHKLLVLQPCQQQKRQTNDSVSSTCRTCTNNIRSWACRDYSSAWMKSQGCICSCSFHSYKSWALLPGARQQFSLCTGSVGRVTDRAMKKTDTFTQFQEWVNQHSFQMKYEL